MLFVKSAENKILFLTVVLFLSFSRPSLLAEDYAVFGSMLIMIISFFFLIKRGRLLGDHRIFVISFFIIFLFLFLFIHSLILGGYDQRAFNTMLLTLLSLIGFLIVFGGEERNNYFFYSSLIFFLLLSYSATISFFLLFFFEYSQILMFDLSISTYKDSTGQFLFPFSNTYGDVLYSYFGLILPRFSFGFRESGIASLFLIWSYFALHEFGLDNTLNKFAIVFSVFLTQSTMGVILFSVFYFINYLYRQKLNILSVRSLISILTFIFFIIVFVQLALISNFFNLLDKLNAGSFFDRYDNAINSIEVLTQNPFGVGLFHSTLEMSQINLIALSSEIGFIGIMLVIVVYCYTIFSSINKIEIFIKISPFFVAWLFFQPMLSSILMFIFLLQRERRFE